MSDQLSKETASDLKSLIDRVEQTALILQNAEFSAKKAKADLESFLHRLQYPPKKSGEA